MDRSPVLAFEDFELDPRGLELRRRGERVELHPKPLRVLAYLARHHDRTISKQELFEQVWPDVVVSETALSSALKQVRRALGDDGGRQRFVQTVRGLGYRFVAPVRERPGAAAPRATAVGRETAPAPPPLKCLAVLPFKNMSPDPANEYFADGVTEDIITQVSKVRDLRVVSTTSSRRYKDTNKSLQEIADELRVGAILEGSIRREGSRVRIVGQLIDAATDTHLWAETFNRQVDDIFEIQQEVAERIAATLKAELTGPERELLAQRPTEAISAYDFYLKGREHYRRWQHEENEAAIELYQKALAADPGFALACAGLAMAYGLRVINHGFDKAWADAAIETAQRALAIDRDLPEAHKALGVGYGAKGLLRQALASYLRAVELSPRYDEALFNVAQAHHLLGEWDEALGWMQRAVALNPRCPLIQCTLAFHLRELGFEPEARRCLERELADDPLSLYGNLILAEWQAMEGALGAARARLERLLAAYPGRSVCLQRAGLLALMASDEDRATSFFERAVAAEGGLEPYSHLGLACCLLRKGKIRKAGSHLEAVIGANRAAIEDGDEEAERRRELSVAACLRGEREEALSWFEQAVEAGWRRYRWDLVDPLFEDLRGDPGFESQITLMRERVEAMRQGVESRGWHRLDDGVGIATRRA